MTHGSHILIVKDKKNIPLNKFAENSVPLSFLCHLSCRVASYGCYKTQRLPLTPNLITTISLVSVMLGIVFLFTGYPIGFALLLPLSYTLDNADGIWARTLGPSSSKGKFLDMYTDYLKDFLVEIFFFTHYYTNLFEAIGNAKIIAIGFGTYLTVKSLFLLMYRESMETVRTFQTQKIRVITYTPAEKYIVVWPLAAFFFPVYLVHLFIIFSAYIFFTALLFLKRWQRIMMNKTIMQAIILAAGQGLRLRPITENLPKCMVELKDNKSLLELSIEKVSRMGIKNILIVVGHAGDKIIKRCKNTYGDLQIRYIHNREYPTSGTMESLASVCGLLENNFLLLESDILYDHKIIEALMNSNHSNVIFAGKPFNAGDDVRISVDPHISHLVRDIGKSTDINTMVKESFIGISKISCTFARLVIDEWFQKYKKINAYYSYEEVFVKVSNETTAHQDKLYMVSNHDLNWGEIDTHEDLEFISKTFRTLPLH